MLFLLKTCPFGHDLSLDHRHFYYTHLLRLYRLKRILRLVPSGDKSEISQEMEGCWLFGLDRKLKNTYDHLLFTSFRSPLCSRNRNADGEHI